MSFKGVLRELKEIKDGFGSTSKRGLGGKNWVSRNRSHIAPDVAPSWPIQQGPWARLPPELLFEIIRRVEESATSWPARASVVYCASVCRSWRDITKEIVKTPEECGRLTFPVSLKQPGPRDVPIQCFIKRDRSTSTYRLYSGLTPSENERDKLLLAGKKIRRATATEFLISLAADDFSRGGDTYVGRLRSNFLGTKFTMHDRQPPNDAAAVQHNNQSSRRLRTKQVSPRLPAYNYAVATVSYELSVLRTRGPRRMKCIMHSIPVSSSQKGGNAPSPTSLPQCIDEKPSPAALSEGKNVNVSFGNVSSSLSIPLSGEPLVLKNKAPRWHEQLQCWCLNFKGRVTVASVKNFQLVADVDPSLDTPAAQQEKVILQFGKIGEDIFTMDYRYPLSAFQAFSICLSSFDTKPVCE